MRATQLDLFYDLVNIKLNNVATFVFEEKENPGYVVKVGGKKGKPTKFFVDVDRNKKRKQNIETLEAGLPTTLIMLYVALYVFLL